MSRLLRLYPKAWRERYGGELVGLLQERPVGVRDSVDIVISAVDAHLHPELIDAIPRPWTHRLPGVLATAAGLIWSGYYVRIVLAAPEEWGYAILLAMLLMLFAVPGDYLVSYGRRIGLAMFAVVAATMLAGVLPTSVGGGVLNVALGAAAALVLSGGMLTLAAVRAGIGPGVRWLLLAVALLIPAVIAIPILGGFGPGDPGGAPAMVVAILPYGIAWTIIGIRMMLRGSETIHDSLSMEPASEVSAT